MTQTACDADGLCFGVTALPEDGGANHAVTVLLSRAVDIARSRLTRTQGATARGKVFRIILRFQAVDALGIQLFQAVDAFGQVEGRRQILDLTL